MSFAPVPTTTQPSCLYSSQGNMICSGRNPNADPYLQTKYQSSCPSKVEKYENYGGNMVNMMKKSASGLGNAIGLSEKEKFLTESENNFMLIQDEEEHFTQGNSKTATNIGYAVSPWPF